MTVVCKVPGSLTFGRLAISEYSVPPSSAPANEEECASDRIVYVIDGVFEFRLRGKPCVVRKGDTLMITRSSGFEYRNTLGTTARFLLIETPCADGRFFGGTADEASAGGGFPPVAYDREIE